MNLEDRRKDTRNMILIVAGMFILLLTAGMVGQLRAQDWVWVWPSHSTLRWHLSTICALVIAGGWALTLMFTVYGISHRLEFRRVDKVIIGVSATISLAGLLGLCYLFGHH